MLMAGAVHDLQLGKERESLLMDAPISCPSYESTEELLATASVLHGWATAMRELDPELRNDSKAANNVGGVNLIRY